MTFITALQNPAAYPHSVATIEVIETHISWVILTGDYAYKIKKPVQFDFLDFSTLEQRKFYCQEELRLNRRLAPDLYCQVVAITGNKIEAKINGDGEVLDYAVQMRQFSSNQLLSVIANKHELPTDTIDQLADLISHFHSHADIANPESSYGSVAMIQHWCLGNFHHIQPLLKDAKLLAQLDFLQQWSNAELENKTVFMQQRKADGFIRECHGDLHLGNIALFNNEVTPFDGIEFNPGLCWIDVMNEIAFLVMDLQERGLKNDAYRFLNHYLSQTGDYQGLSLLRYYLVYRALVRAKVALLSWQQHQQPEHLTDYQNYTNLAQSFTQLEPAKLIITHGYSASGKSTISAQLAESLGLIQLRADVERQRLFAKLKPSRSLRPGRFDIPLNQGIYAAEKITRTYQKLAELATNILEAGFSVIVDATFLQQSQRQLFQQLAIEQQAKFFILDIQADIEELIQRIEQRQQSGQDASEATIAVLQQQLKNAQPLTADEQNDTISVMTGSPLENCQSFIHQIIQSINEKLS